MQQGRRLSPQIDEEISSILSKNRNIGEIEEKNSSILAESRDFGDFSENKRNFCFCFSSVGPNFRIRGIIFVYSRAFTPLRAHTASMSFRIHTASTPCRVHEAAAPLRIRAASVQHRAAAYRRAAPMKHPLPIRAAFSSPPMPRSPFIRCETRPSSGTMAL